MLTQLKCEGDIAEQLAPKYITLSQSYRFDFQMEISCVDNLSLYSLHIIF